MVHTWQVKGRGRPPLMGKREEVRLLSVVPPSASPAQKVQSAQHCLPVHPPEVQDVCQLGLWPGGGLLCWGDSPSASTWLPPPTTGRGAQKKGLFFIYLIEFIQFIQLSGNFCYWSCRFRHQDKNFCTICTSLSYVQGLWFARTYFINYSAILPIEAYRNCVGKDFSLARYSHKSYLIICPQLLSVSSAFQQLLKSPLKDLNCETKPQSWSIYCR